MKAILVTCPHCGGRLQVAEARDTVTCDYCGAVARLQRRTRVFERPLPPPPSPPGRALPVAVQHRTRGVATLALGSVIGTLAFGGAVAYVATRAVRGTLPGGGGGGRVSWQGTTPPIPVDIDGDGKPELLGRTRRVIGADEIRIAVLDAGTGAVRWESESVGTYSDTYQGTLATIGDLALFASALGEVRALGLADGKLRWSARFDERIAQFCDRGGALVAVGVDKVERPLDRASGAAPAAAPGAGSGAGRGATAEAPPAEARGPARPERPEPGRSRDRRAAARPAARPTARPAEAAPEACAPSDQRPRPSRSVPYELRGRLDLDASEIAVGPGGRVAAGTRRKGTRVPTLVAIAADGGAGWRAEVPADPLAAQPSAPELTVVGETATCTTYRPRSSPNVAIACFALADGKRLWEGRAALPTPMSGLQLVGDAVLISQWGTLEARDVATGATRWRFGR